MQSRESWYGGGENVSPGSIIAELIQMPGIAINLHQGINGSLDPLVNQWSVKPIALEDVAQMLVDGDGVLLGTWCFPNEIGKAGLEGSCVGWVPV